MYILTTLTKLKHMTKEVRYPYLPEGREILYVGLDNEFMKEAQDAARRLSTEHNHPTGAVVVKDGEIIGKGGNQSGFKNQKLQELHNKKGLCVRKWIKAKSGTLYWACPGCAPFSSHGERQALKDAQKKGNDTHGADLYLYGHWWACGPCWDAMIEAGINNVYLLENSEVLFERNNPDNIIRTQFSNH
jgi:tRNA(Arg) A34 adenosine deaminase TadA